MTTAVRIGDLNRRVKIERAVRADDGGGGASISWELEAEVWAAIWPRSADEVFVLERVAGRASHDIWIRYRAGIKPEMRVRHGARIFDILGVIDVEDRHQWLRCPSQQRDL